MDQGDEWEILAAYQDLKRRSPELAAELLRFIRTLNSFQNKLDPGVVSE